MAEQLENYRKAKKEELKCASCAFSFYDYRKRLRCLGVYGSQSVGKAHTCDYGRPKKHEKHD